MYKVRSKFHPVELLKKRVLYKYFEEGMSIEKIAKELNEPSERILYKWVQDYRNLYPKLKKVTGNVKISTNADHSTKKISLGYIENKAKVPIPT